MMITIAIGRLRKLPILILLRSCIAYLHTHGFTRLSVLFSHSISSLVILPFRYPFENFAKCISLCAILCSVLLENCQKHIAAVSTPFAIY